VIVGLSFGTLVESKNSCLIYPEEWLDGINYASIILKAYLLCQHYG